jgi:hypothetical protein
MGHRSSTQGRGWFRIAPAVRRKPSIPQSGQNDAATATAMSVHSFSIEVHPHQ